MAERLKATGTRSQLIGPGVIWWEFQIAHQHNSSYLCLGSALGQSATLKAGSRLSAIRAKESGEGGTIPVR